MNVTEILKLQNNVLVEGTFALSDIKLKPFNERDGHFLTFSLSDKTGIVWAKLWDNAESIAEQLKDIQVVTIKGRTNIYNEKMQVVVEKIKKADSYNLKDLMKIASKDPEEMWTEIKGIMEANLSLAPYKLAWEKFESSNILDKFKLWPGGKGTVHHAYQHGLLEHTLSVINFAKQLYILSSLDQGIDLNKILIGALFHDVGKIDAYNYTQLKTTMTDIGRLHEHTVLSYFKFRSIVGETDQSLVEDVGHIILSHHGKREQSAVIVPMTLEAKIVAFADNLDADTNYMNLQLTHNTDDQGWFFDSLTGQFFFKRPNKRRKLMV
ncbi:MAG: HD domain-containing protein [Candidatus Nanoarchaeia archaeon]|nr:HD domain-containing protein [Candidatus Nanoarchaeia archaeon]